MGSDRLNLSDGARIRLLIVDDSPDDAELIAIELREAGLQVDAYRVDTPEALRGALEQPWDLVVCDHAMPRFDSASAFRLANSVRPELPFVIVSGQLGEQAGDEAVLGGVADYISKDQLHRLVPVVARELRNRTRLEQVAELDATTRLPGRAAICRLAQARLVRGGALALVVIALDRFRLINEQFGMQAGDRLLRAVAARLATRFGRQSVGRLGGDQFLLLAEPGSEGVRDAVQATHELLGPPFQQDDQEIYLTASLGSSRSPEDGPDFSSALTQAEEAMRIAKRAGRNRHRPTLLPTAADSGTDLDLERRLRLALEAGQLLLYYQPQLDLPSGAISSTEALLRWRHPELGLLPPARFIPLAEENGLIIKLGRWALLEACRQGVAGWPCLNAHEHDALTVAVNISARQLHEQDLAKLVRGVLEETGLPSTRLQLELTEGTLSIDTEGAVRSLRAIKELGVQVVVDNFGTGYASLNYLRRFPLDILKVDRRLVASLTTESSGHDRVDALIQLGHQLGLSVAAAGVETEVQATTLAALGCDRLQGYLYSPPLPADEFGPWLLATGNLPPR